MSRLLLFFFLFICQPSIAQLSRDVAVELEAKIEGATYIISWQKDARATGYQIHRRLAGTTSWGVPITLTSSDTAYIDTTLAPGQLYEFRVRKSIKVGSDSYAWGYIYGGIDVLHPNYQGTLILVVDDLYAEQLREELTRLLVDLLNEGWTVRRVDVKRNWLPSQVKDSIIQINNQDPNTKAVFLFGHVPVPYSGPLVPDGHPDHYGAWPADGYYGELDQEWYDEADNDTLVVYNNNGQLDTAIVRKANRNVAGDGKFDDSQFPDAIDLEVGRVDLANMSNFPLTEVQLLKQYLDKDHAYRTGAVVIPKRALIDDQFGYFGGEAFASSAWRAFPQLVGRDSIKSLDWFTTLRSEPYLWAYGCGGGWDQGAGGIGITEDFDTIGSKATFTMLFGSYFGDWNTNNNFLRAPLATESGLSCAWSGRPYWYFHPMGIGKTLGFCARLTQNNVDRVTTNFVRQVHIALMGDPTLRMNPIIPPANLSLVNEGLNRVHLTWTPSTDESINGYHIYKAHTPTGPYYLSNETPVTLPSFTDTLPFQGTNVYMVHAVKREVTPAGSYWNLSPAARGVLEGVQSGVVHWGPQLPSIVAMETSFGTEFKLVVPHYGRIRFSLYNSLGTLVKFFDDRPLSSGTYQYTWTAEQKQQQSNGVYFAVVESENGVKSVKILNSK